jgi:ribosome recycling factor
MARNFFIDLHLQQFTNALEAFKKDLQGLRTGRASTVLVEEVLVEAYGSMQPIKQVASLSIPENNAIAIVPWDKSIMKDIENALTKANLGLSIINTGDKVIAKLPLMTEDNRKAMVKVLGTKAEDARITVRQLRDEVKSAIIAAEKNKEIAEDDKYQNISELDEYIVDMNKQIEEARAAKEKEIMTV